MTYAQGQAYARPQQLKNARESVGLSLDQVARALKIDRADVQAWETGSASPDDDQLWRLAELYGRPVGYFFTEGEATPTRQDFRTTQARSQPHDPDVRRFATAVFEELCRARHVLGDRRGEKRGSLIRALRDAARGEEDPEALAQTIRQSVRLGSNPIPDIRQLLEQWGIAVFLVNLPRAAAKRSLAGTCWWHPVFGPAALANRSDSAGRRAFTLAHELAHLLRLDVQPLCDLNDSAGEERFANRFATAFLMPREDLLPFAQTLHEAGDLAGWDTTRAAIARVATRYNTSVEATSLRLEEVGFLPKGYTDANRTELGREYFRGSKGKRWRKAVADLGQAYLESVRTAYESRQLSIAAVADLLQIDVEQAVAWLEEADESI